MFIECVYKSVYVCVCVYATFRPSKIRLQKTTTTTNCCPFRCALFYCFLFFSLKFFFLFWGFG